MAHAFLVDNDIIAFARSWEQEQTGEENKGDKHSIVHTCTQSDTETLVNKHEKQYAVSHFSPCQCGGKPENLMESLLQSMGLWKVIISIQHHCNVIGTNLIIGESLGFLW